MSDLAGVSGGYRTFLNQAGTRFAEKPPWRYQRKSDSSTHENRDCWFGFAGNWVTAAKKQRSDGRWSEWTACFLSGTKKPCCRSDRFFMAEKIPTEDELGAAIGALLDNELPNEQFLALQSRLKCDSRAREMFVQQTTMHALLEMHFAEVRNKEMNKTPALTGIHFPINPTSSPDAHSCG
jgi:hypothetical protein